MTQTCSNCLIEQPISNFPLNRVGRPGRRKRCKSCVAADMRLSNAIKSMLTKSPRKQNLSKPYHSPAKKEWRKNNQAQVAAVTAFNNAKQAGKIKVATACSVCGDEGRLEGHHEDYSRPLDVIWLCRSCHLMRHGKSKKQKS